MPQLDFSRLAFSTIVFPNALATEAFGQQLAPIIKAPTLIFLEGELGAGKTTLVRGFLKGFGYEGSVKSPTFTLVEPYQFETCRIYHFDLYRLNAPEELEFIGIRDYFSDDAIILVEWPERGLGFFPKPDLILALNVVPEGRSLNMDKKR